MDLFVYVYAKFRSKSKSLIKTLKIDVKEMIAAVYLKIQTSRYLMDWPKESIRCEKAAIKI